jgi:hypothetical protein
MQSGEVIILCQYLEARAPLNSIDWLIIIHYNIQSVYIFKSLMREVEIRLT